MSIYDKLKQQNITLPQPRTPAANYLPYLFNENNVFISGQVCVPEYLGTLGKDVDIETGILAARQCAINLLAQLEHACEGDLNRVESCIRLGVFVNATADFTNHPQIANGASDLIVEIFGEKGKHVRAAVGCVSLPLNSAVEVEGLFKIKN